jgi:hypothetical protein
LAKEGEAAAGLEEEEEDEEEEEEEDMEEEESATVMVGQPHPSGFIAAHSGLLESKPVSEAILPPCSQTSPLSPLAHTIYV